MTDIPRATRRRAWRNDWRNYLIGPTERGRPSRKVRRTAWKEAWAEEFRDPQAAK